MANPVLLMNELVDSRSPSSFGLSQEGSRATIRYDLSNFTLLVGDIRRIAQLAYQVVVGYRQLSYPTGPFVTTPINYNINTLEPQVHPINHRMHANAILNIQGVGKFAARPTVLDNPSEFTGNVKLDGLRTPPYHTEYEKYEESYQRDVEAAYRDKVDRTCPHERIV